MYLSKKKFEAIKVFFIHLITDHVDLLAERERLLKKLTEIFNS